MAAESDLERKIREFAEFSGCYTRKFTSAHVGVPDRIITKNGLTLFLEIKAPGERPTAMQRDEINLINAVGGFATWVDEYEGALAVIECLLASRADWLKDECDTRNFWMSKPR